MEGGLLGSPIKCWPQPPTSWESHAASANGDRGHLFSGNFISRGWSPSRSPWCHTHTTQHQGQVLMPSGCAVSENMYVCMHLGFPGDLDGKESACNAQGPGSTPGLERCSGEGNGYPLQYSCCRIPWTEELGGLQFMGSQSQTRLSD